MFKPNTTADWFYMETNKTIPQSTTHEMLERGQQRQRVICTVCKKLLNFQTYPLNDFRFENMEMELGKEWLMSTSYQRDYGQPYDNRCKIPTMAKENIPDNFWNRKPLNDFGKERITTSEFMFMDDHLINVTEQRKRVNFLRQIRNQHHPLT